MSLKLSFIGRKKSAAPGFISDQWWSISTAATWPFILSPFPFSECISYLSTVASEMPFGPAESVLSSLTPFAFTLFTTTLHCLLYLITLTKWLWNQTYSLKHLWQSSFLNHNFHLVSFQGIIFKA